MKRKSCTTKEVGIRKAVISELEKGKLQENEHQIPAEAQGTKVQRGEETYHAEVKVEMPILKKHEEKRLVTGIILEPETVDGQGDVVGSEVIESAAHNFLSKYNRETQMGLLHKMFGEIGVELVESWISPMDMELGGEKVKEGTWMMTCRVLDDLVWSKIKNGGITGFSIGGTALVAAVQDAA